MPREKARHPSHIKTGSFGCSPLSIVEVGGDGDDGVLDLLPRILFGGLLRLDEDRRQWFSGRLHRWVAGKHQK